MKNVPIKFRGVGLNDGKYHYGWYLPGRPMSSFPAILDEEGYYQEIKRNSVRQLVGYDAAGEEVYEGDTVNCYHSFCLPAEELKKKKIEKVSRVELVAMVDCYNEDLNAPFDYQFLKKSKVIK